MSGEIAMTRAAAIEEVMGMQMGLAGEFATSAQEEAEARLFALEVLRALGVTQEELDALQKSGGAE